jgi:energy-coupling factor transporter ATP-binding protein EcfA2
MGIVKADVPDLLNIDEALARFPHVVIVGDPGSGKSTFLRFIALMLARSTLENDYKITTEKLGLCQPFPIPVFLSCRELSGFLRSRQLKGILKSFVEFMTEVLAGYKFPIKRNRLDLLLRSGNCCLLIDGLDEVPTEIARGVVSRVIEACVTEYPNNRYVVTSRIRAYKGDTILRGGFVRCDIQPFNDENRQEFLRNWFALLLQKPKESILERGTDGFRAYGNLLRAIEKNDRIKTLAVNPLLLTVTAIVHWNRKRLPEQRVDLYDECVDVLLGQRKEAEQAQRSREADLLDETNEESKLENRAWVRKRFSEIALKILCTGGEELCKSAVCKVLCPRFLDRGVISEEQAVAQAELFLDRHELRSGLLVSRRQNRYRFVHFAFQEYLSAWNLANKDFDIVKSIVYKNMTGQRWFEPLQLLGGELAKKSDELFDKYILFLLNNLGSGITDQATVVALCFNILNDTGEVASIKPKTRALYEASVEKTLGAFDKDAKVPEKTQSELLEALIKIGGPVKAHIIKATKSKFHLVRIKAIRAVLPFLTDDELFSLDHVLGEDDEEILRVYLEELLKRDSQRTVKLLIDFQNKSTNKLRHLLADSFDRISKCSTPKNIVVLFRDVIENAEIYTSPENSLLKALAENYSKHRYLWDTVSHIAQVAKLREFRLQGLLLLASRREANKEVRETIAKVIYEDQDAGIRRRAMELLTSNWNEEEQTWRIVRDIAARDGVPQMRQRALEILAETRKDRWTRGLVKGAARVDPNTEVRIAALALLVNQFSDDTQTWAEVLGFARKDKSQEVRSYSLNMLALKRTTEPTTWRLIRHIAIGNEDDNIRSLALELLAEHCPDDDKTVEILTRVALENNSGSLRALALDLLSGKHDTGSVWHLVLKLASDSDEQVRLTALERIASRSDRYEEQKIVMRAAERDGSELVRVRMVELMSEWDEREEAVSIIRRIAREDHNYLVKQKAKDVLLSCFGDITNLGEKEVESEDADDRVIREELDELGLRALRPEEYE